jgi:glycosyltransferase involved in cell wall biosynthesis
MKTAKLHILFDANSLLGNRTGIGHYTARLIRHIAEQYPNVELTGYYYNFLGRKQPPTTPAAPNITYRPILLLPGPFVNLLRRLRIEVPIELLAFKRADFVLYPNFLSHPSLFHAPNAPVIHDLTYLDYPASGSDKNIRDLQMFVPRVIARASFIVTVSEFSKRRIEEAYDVPAESIITTFIPPNEVLRVGGRRQAELLEAKGITKPYIFFLGTMEPRKNVSSLLEAYTMLPEALRQTYSLVLAGKIDWKYQETLTRLEGLQKDGYDIHYLGYVDDDTQAALYQGARLFVLPSLYEGFGMQIAEALSYGVPCALSDIPVFHEVGGDSVSYFDHTNPRAIAKSLQENLESPRPKAAKLQKQLSSYPTWPSITAKLIERIQQVMKEKTG